MSTVPSSKAKWSMPMSCTVALKCQHYIPLMCPNQDVKQCFKRESLLLIQYHSFFLPEERKNLNWIEKINVSRTRPVHTFWEVCRTGEYFNIHSKISFWWANVCRMLFTMLLNWWEVFLWDIQDNQNFVEINKCMKSQIKLTSFAHFLRPNMSLLSNSLCRTIPSSFAGLLGFVGCFQSAKISHRRTVRFIVT